jgi:hypothetical protein
MFRLVQEHHGISTTNLAALKASLRAVGFTATQPGAPQPLIYRNRVGDPIGQLTAAVLGDHYETHYVENPETGQQIDLIELDAGFTTPRLSARPMQGDLVIGLQAADPRAAYPAMRSADPTAHFGAPLEDEREKGLRFTGRDGQHFVLTSERPFAVLHYSAQDWPAARRFYEEVLRVGVSPRETRAPGVRRFGLDGIHGRMDIEVSAETPRMPFGEYGKHYPAANHYRLVGRDVDGIVARLAASGLGGFVLPAFAGFAFVHGPANETIEIFSAGPGVLEVPSAA